MVKLNSEDVCGNEAVFVQQSLMLSKKSKGYDGSGFRLQELNRNGDLSSTTKDCPLSCDDIDTATSVSGHSTYKQRIDAMFDDSRSVASTQSRNNLLNNGEGRFKLVSGCYRHRFPLNEEEENDDTIVQNSIQKKIEKMFEEISLSGFEKNSSLRNSGKYHDQHHHRNYVPESLRSEFESVSHDFKVAYLGSQPLTEKTVTLITLQEPLKNLYVQHMYKNAFGGFRDILKINKEGLRIQIHRDNVIMLNPFATIAVWASVKLTYRKTKGEKSEYAFIPLIKDPDGVDQNILFQKLTPDVERALSASACAEGCLLDEPTNTWAPPPIFTVVMRNTQLKTLECHGIMCMSSEEAIIIAANLYQALMKKMNKKTKVTKGEEKQQCSESQKNSEAIHGDINNDSGNDNGDDDHDDDNNKSGHNYNKSSQTNVGKKSTMLDMPCRPPRKNKESDIPAENQTNFEKILPRQDVVEEAKMVARRSSVPVNAFSNLVGQSTDDAAGCTTSLRRSVSERANRNGCIENIIKHQDGGDILTKVAIPRSRSFLNANGPLTRYSRRQHKVTVLSDGELSSSPLGFTELFNEFRQNEGLESMDDILNAIIDAEGMSFNDLKPIYKEFLLKLAVTLTKDELFQRSKNIMKKQRKKNRKKKGKALVYATIGLKRVFRKTASKLKASSKPKNSRPTTLEFTSVVFQSSRKVFETSTTSTFTGIGLRKSRRRQSSRRRVKRPLTRKKMIVETSEDSDCLNRKTNGNDSGGCPNRSSSGYFSCSECSYDSENCTCTSADKCYCALGKNKYNDEKEEKTSSIVTVCCCDTESCADSRQKCYCASGDDGSNNANLMNVGMGISARSNENIVNLSDIKGICQTPHLHQDKIHNTNCPNFSQNHMPCKKHSRTIFEQLKEQGFVASSDSSLSRAASPLLQSSDHRQNESRIKTSKSLEFLQMRPARRMPAATRQQMQECPAPPSAKVDNNTNSSSSSSSTQENHISRRRRRRREMANFVEGTRHFCYHGSDAEVPSSRRKIGMNHMRQYSSMRMRSHSSYQIDTNTDKSRLPRAFSSMRATSTQRKVSLSHHLANSSTNSAMMMKHVLFPEKNGSINSSLRFPKRMDVYMTHRRSSCLPTSPVASSQHLSKRCVSIDNFPKLDYDLFTAKADTSETERSSEKRSSDRKVLVVSARDPKGKVLFMGASSRGENVKDKLRDKNAANASEALSVKKSAEIAALFTDVTCAKQKPTMVGAINSKIHSRSNSYRCTNMENTLGYLP